MEESSIDGDISELPAVLPYTTPFAAVTPRVTGGLSAVSSCLLVYMILVSDKKLTTIYHRIMFFMSCADIMNSVALALTTLPMPNTLPDAVPPDAFDIPYDEWSGSKLGNTYTCNLQGFFLSFGITSMYAYNAMLCVYHACSIALTMKEKTIRTYVEPMLHLIPFAIGISMSVYPLFFDLYNPSPWEAWCTATPLGCDLDSPGKPCVRGSYRWYAYITIFASSMLGTFFFVIILTLSMVSVRVIRVSRSLEIISKAQYGMYGKKSMETKLIRRQRKRVLERAREHHETTRLVLTQALVYILAFFATLLFSIVQLLGLQGEGNYWPHYLELVFMPMQGFFNFAIFLYYKVMHYRRFHPEVTVMAVIRLFFAGRAVDPVFMSRISLLKYDEERKVVEVQFLSEDVDEVVEECLICGNFRKDDHDVVNDHDVVDDHDDAVDHDHDHVDDRHSAATCTAIQYNHHNSTSRGDNSHRQTEEALKRSPLSSSHCSLCQSVCIPDGDGSGSSSRGQDLSGFDIEQVVDTETEEEDVSSNDDAYAGQTMNA